MLFLHEIYVNYIIERFCSLCGSPFSSGVSEEIQHAVKVESLAHLKLVLWARHIVKEKL